MAGDEASVEEEAADEDDVVVVVLDVLEDIDWDGG